MSEVVKFMITDAGKNAALNAAAKQIRISLAKVGLGSGQYQADASKTAMVSKFGECNLAAAGILPEVFALRFTLIMNGPIERKVSEIGIYTDTGVLFAIAAKPSGSFFTLYPATDRVANFALMLEDVPASAIAVIQDNNASNGVKLIQDHLLAPDPHPQYKQYANQILQDHLLAPDPHPQYALKLFVMDEFKKIDQKIKNFLGIAQLFFPPLLRVGRDVGGASVVSRPAGANYSYLDSGLVYLCSPESGHEAWDTTREVAKISTSVFNRSGTSRIAYNGPINWLVLDTTRTLLKDGFLEPTTQYANEIKSGVFEANQSAVINRQSWESLKYTDPNVVLLISPEGGHEAWDIRRADNQITISPFNRSGTNRIGYSGRMNWTLLKATTAANKGNDYPRLLMAGTAANGDFSIPVPEGENFEFTDPNYAIFVTPEGGHEGWTVTREAKRFVVSVYNRSGQNRVGYSGRVNWAIFAADKAIKRTVYYEGQHAISVASGEKIVVELYAAGGGGGGAIHNYSSAVWNIPCDGFAAQDTSLSYQGSTAIAGGGKGGGGAHWGNGSAFSNGSPGAGGVNNLANLGVFSLLTNLPGNAAIIGSRWERQPGGVATSLASGFNLLNSGGQGAWGIGDEKWSYGGGGGSGGFVKVEFMNVSNAPVTLDLKVGAVGLGWVKPSNQTNGNPGDNGGIGFAVVNREV